MKKFICTLFLALLTVTSWAYDVNIDGIYYNLNKSTKEAEVTNYSSGPGSNSYKNDVTIPPIIEIDSIPYRVTSIGKYTFYGCKSLKSVEMPGTIASIGYAAFHGCTGVTSIVIPDSVTTIGEIAFEDCSALKQVKIGNSVTDIGTWAFRRCTSLPVTDNIRYADTYLVEVTDRTLSSYTIKTGTKFISILAFSLCMNMTSITIPSSVISIGHGVFEECKSLSTIKVESGNQYYDSRNDCNAIIETASGLLVAGCRNTIIPNTVTSIGVEAFAGCNGLTSIEIPNSVTSIESGAFVLCTSLTSIELPNSVTSIGGNAFQNCTALVSVTIPNSVTSIEWGTFSDCPSLTSIEIPNSITCIGGAAFQNCTGLTSVTIPETVTTISYQAFDGCHLKNVMSKSEIAPTIEPEVFSARTYTHANLYIPYGSWDGYVYTDDTYWYQFNNIHEQVDNVEDVSECKVYALMTSRFNFATYDEVNDKLIEDNISAWDESNLNQAWQFINIDGGNYLYNLGAKKYAADSPNGIVLACTPSSVALIQEDGSIKIGNGNYVWYFVENEQLMPKEGLDEEVSAVRGITTNDTDIAFPSYNISGQRVNAITKGIVIQNGKKVVVK